MWQHKQALISQREAFILLFNIGATSKRAGELEIRDVHADDRRLLTRWSKEHFGRGSDKNTTNIRVEGKHVEFKSSVWEVPETAKCISK